MDAFGNGNLVWFDLKPGTQGGIVIGTTQSDGGQMGQFQGTSSNPGQIDAAWKFFGSYGTDFTYATALQPSGATANAFASATCTSGLGTTACSDGSGSTTKLGAWGVSWNSTNPPNGSPEGGGLVDTWIVSGANYTLDYRQPVPINTSAFFSAPYGLHLEGVIVSPPTSTPTNKNTITPTNTPTRTNTPSNTPTNTYPPRGVAGDTWADVIIGKPDYSEVNMNSTVGNKLLLPSKEGRGGVVVDRSQTPNKLYIYDSGNSRILGLELVNAPSEDPGQCNLSSTNNPLNCAAKIVIGQPNMNTSACNGDSGFQNYPSHAPAAAATLCTEQDDALSIVENGSGAIMAVDSNGNLYVADYFNHRVLKYNSPFTTDSMADAVWGQNDFTGRTCNKGMASPDATSLCLWQPRGSADAMSGVEVDSSGNLWIADSANNRVLRFPPGSKTADLVLGQPGFTSNAPGSGLNQLQFPAAVRVNALGRVYVSDYGNSRVLYYDPAPQLFSGMNGTVFGSISGQTSAIRSPANLNFDPTQPGIWIANMVPDDVSYQPLQLWDETTQTQIKGISMRADGGVGIDSDGNLFAPSCINGNYPDDVVEFAKGTTTNPVRLFGGSYGKGNLVTSYSLDEVQAVAVVDNQLIAAEATVRVLFWNNPASLSGGQASDGIIYPGDPLAYFQQNESMAADQNHDLFLARTDWGNNPRILVYQTPLSSASTPFLTISGTTNAIPIPLLGGGTINLGQYSWGLVPTPAGDILWVSDSQNNRVVRIRNPLSTNRVVDVVLGQPSSTSISCNQGGGATANTLCLPGSLALDRYGNLWVSDHAGEGGGNQRLLEFDASLFLNLSQVLYGPSASKIYANMATWQPAFDSQNRMVVGFDPYGHSPNPNGGWFPAVYYSPLTADPSTPDAYLKDYFSCAYSIAFDLNDNLYVGDGCRSRVLIYKNPLP